MNQVFLPIRRAAWTAILRITDVPTFAYSWILHLQNGDVTLPRLTLDSRDRPAELRFIVRALLPEAIASGVEFISYEGAHALVRFPGVMAYTGLTNGAAYGAQTSHYLLNPEVATATLSITGGELVGTITKSLPDGSSSQLTDVTWRPPLDWMGHV